MDGHVASITQRRDGRLTIGTFGAGLFDVTSDGRATNVAVDPAVHADSVRLILEDSAGGLWVVGRNALWSLHERATKVMSPSGTPLVVTHLVQVAATGELIAQSPSGIYRIAPGGVRQVGPPPRTPNATIGLWTDGKATWTLAGGDVFRNGRRVFSLFERRTVSTTLVDREGSLWLGTDTGLHRLVPTLVTTYSTPEGVAHPSIYPTYVDRSGAVWLGTWAGGASRIDPVTGRVTNLSAGIHPFVNSFFEDETGRLWVGGAHDRGNNGGVYVCTMSTMKCRADGSPDMRNNAVYALHGNADGRL